jgi:glycosyltransferase involved in cell wall biosynthesis
MSVFNAGKFLAPAVESVLGQTFQDFEFVVVDDGSTDDSPSVLSGFRDPRITVIRQENRGIAAALNRAIEVAQGEYLARQDADDISLPDRFAAQVRFLDEHPEVAVLGTAARLVDSDGRPFSRFATYVRHERLVKELKRGFCPLMHGSVMLRRQAIVEAGGYDPRFERIQDVELWLRMSHRYRLANLRDTLYLLRKHDGSVTQDARIDLRIRAFAESGKLTTHIDPGEWLRFVDEFDRTFAGSRWARAFAAEDLLRGAQIAMAQGAFWPGIRKATGALWLNPRLAIDLPRRLWHRARRTLLPMAK